MKTVYTIDQIIDLEYFLHEDTTSSPEELHLRDRKIALQLSQNTPGQEITTAELISGWVHSRRKNEFSGESKRSPGTLFVHSRSLASTLTSVKGLLTGLFAGWAFFAYAGTTPVNVLQFLFFFVFSQLLIAVVLCTGLSVRKYFPTLTLPNTSFHILYSLGRKLFVLINKNWLEKMPADKRQSIRHAYGIIRSKNKTYGSLFYWPIFSLAQLFGITFNIGLLTTTFIKIVTSDLAFGWQSTLQLSDTAIAKMVHLLALPWSWFLPPGIGTPTLSQIAGSHIILKDGIYHLTTGDLVAWWPFLLLSLIFYGLLVRIGFYTLGRLLEGRSLARLQLTTPPCMALLRRMQTPIVTTQAVTEAKDNAVASSTQSPRSGPEESTTGTPPQILLIPDDIYEFCRPEEIQPFMEKKGVKIIERHRFMQGYDEDQQLLETLKNISWKENKGVLIIMESWMVPLVDFLVFLKDMRKITTAETIIEIALTGQVSDTVFTDVSPRDLDIWRKKIESIGDPYLYLAPITGISQ